MRRDPRAQRRREDHGDQPDARYAVPHVGARPPVRRCRPTAGRRAASRGAMLQDSGVPATLTVRELVDLFRSYYPAPLTRGCGAWPRRPCRAGAQEGRQAVRRPAPAPLLRARRLRQPAPAVPRRADRRHGRGLAERLPRHDQRDYAAAGRTVVLTTHFMEEADQVARRIVVIDRGPGHRRRAPRRDQGARRGQAGPLPDRIAACDVDLLRGLPLTGLTTRDSEVRFLANEPEPILAELFRRGAAVSGSRGWRRRSRGCLPRIDQRAPAAYPRRWRHEPRARTGRRAPARTLPRCSRCWRSQSMAQAKSFLRTPAVSVISFAMPVILFVFFGLPALGTPLPAGRRSRHVHARVVRRLRGEQRHGVQLRHHDRPGPRPEGRRPHAGRRRCPASVYLPARTITALGLGLVGLLVLFGVALRRGRASPGSPGRTWRSG